MTSTAAYPDLSHQHTLAAATALILPGNSRAVTVQIKTGTTANVATTLSSPADIAAGNADWVAWADGSRAGPYIGVTVGPCTAIKLLSALGGTVFTAR